ncbi:hypothetical protein Hamer_G032065 [Homarus americanus]|uniref:Uncharacterized protein n=1 Tax=Homarus americanus TaxID=6706 RepID=A0A8J5MS90_HOMAM|nr:hypothetical protein Hamer_G032065 [Homarus americanus]
MVRYTPAFNTSAACICLSSLQHATEALNNKATDQERHRGPMELNIKIVVAAAFWILVHHGRHFHSRANHENRAEVAHTGGRHKIIDNETLDLIVMLLKQTL